MEYTEKGKDKLHYLISEFMETQDTKEDHLTTYTPFRTLGTLTRLGRRGSSTESIDEDRIDLQWWRLFCL